MLSGFLITPRYLTVRQILVAGNWKLNGSAESNNALVSGILEGMASVSCEVAVCPSYPYLAQVGGLLAGSALKLGAQSVSEESSGAFTGEVSTSMLADLGCHYVIVGHSERRAIYGESNELVAKKFAAVVAAGMVPILCLGETLEEREQGVTERVVGEQLDAVTGLVGVAGMENAVLAYEPVWAIGTGKTASSEQAQAVHAFLRGKLEGLSADVAASTKILYGGSVKPDNAAELFSCADIDGGLIGGAALKADSFLGICKAG